MRRSRAGWSGWSTRRWCWPSRWRAGGCATGCWRPCASTGGSGCAATAGTTRSSAGFVGWATGFVERAEQGLRGPDEADWVHRVEIEFANVRAAWEQALRSGDLVAAGRIAVALSEHAQLRSLHEPWSWAITLARRADLADEALADEALTISVFGAAAVASSRLGDPDAAEAFARAGLARPGGNRWRCLHPLSTALMMRGDHEGAARCCAEGAAEPDCPPVVQAYLEANGWLARIYAGTATPEDVEGPVRRLVHGDWPSGRAWGWFVAGEAVRMADPAECIRRLQRSTEIARAARSPFILALAEVGLLAAAAAYGRPRHRGAPVPGGHPRLATGRELVPAVDDAAHARHPARRAGCRRAGGGAARCGRRGAGGTGHRWGRGPGVRRPAGPAGVAARCRPVRAGRRVGRRPAPDGSHRVRAAGHRGRHRGGLAGHHALTSIAAAAIPAHTGSTRPRRHQATTAAMTAPAPRVHRRRSRSGAYRRRCRLRPPPPAPGSESKVGSRPAGEGCGLPENINL